MFVREGTSPPLGLRSGAGSFVLFRRDLSNYPCKSRVALNSAYRRAEYISIYVDACDSPLTHTRHGERRWRAAGIEERS